MVRTDNFKIRHYTRDDEVPLCVINRTKAVNIYPVQNLYAAEFLDEEEWCDAIVDGFQDATELRDHIVVILRNGGRTGVEIRVDFA